MAYPLKKIWYIPGLIMILVALTVTLIPSIPYLQDYMEWVYQAWLLTEYIGGKDIGVCLVNYPVPNGGLFALLLLSLVLVIGWLGAIKVYVVLYAVAFGWGLLRLIKHWDIKGKWQALVVGVAIVVFSFSHWGGFVSYQLSLVVFVWFLGGYSRDSGWSYVLLYSLLAYLAHGAGVILIVGIIIASIVFDNFKRKQLVGIIPVLGLGIWYLLASDPTLLPYESPLTLSSSSKAKLLAWKTYNLAKSGPYRSFLMWNGENATEVRVWMYYLGSAANVLFVGLIGLLSSLRLLTWWRNRRTLSSAEHTSGYAFSALCLCCMIMHFIFPSNFLGIHYVFLRLFIPLAFLVLITNDQVQSKLRTGIALFCLLFFAFSLINYSQVVTARKDVDYDQVFYDYQARTSQQYFAYRIFGLDIRWDLIQAERYDPIVYPNGLLIECESSGE